MHRFLITGLFISLFQWSSLAQQDTFALEYYFYADSVFSIEPENPVITHYLVESWRVGL